MRIIINKMSDPALQKRRKGRPTKAEAQARKEAEEKFRQEQEVVE
jgi:hypothetical protein